MKDTCAKRKHVNHKERKVNHPDKPRKIAPAIVTMTARESRVQIYQIFNIFKSFNILIYSKLSDN